MKRLIWVALGAILAAGLSATPTIYNYFSPGCALSGTATSQTVNLGTGGCIAGNLAISNLASGSGASSTTYFRGDNSWATPSGTTGANPTATVGITATNGTSTSFMRADAAPALSQTISPTMTGNWTFTPGSGTAITVNAPSSVSGIFIHGGSTVDIPIDMEDGHAGSTGQYSFRLGHNTVNDFEIYDDVNSAARLTLLQTGDLIVGTATGGGGGAGTLNAQNLFINGASVATDVYVENAISTATASFNKTYAMVISGLSSGCTVTQYIPNSAFTCARTGVGAYTITFPVSYWTVTPICTATINEPGPIFVGTNSISTTSMKVTTYENNGSALDEGFTNITCVGN